MGNDTVNRNRVQIDVHDRILHDKAYRAVEHSVARNLESWKDWTEKGYAAAFDEAWKCGMRDVDSITTYVIACANSRNAVAVFRRGI